ncbi:cellulose synthase-like protein H1 [Daucus carota subsp. sativus]|uniref:cellulose synthase-like protein H1 n=1 Tax=Daucus carota subsp. sativus TaxID=79200 RepID=UPI0007EFAF39|nr:PREDICTED: cellulose synthase-like protein H1 [Daucus carota subsp. sativus]
MAKQSSLPLFQRVSLRSDKSIALELLLLFLLFSLLTYHFFSIKQYGIPVLLAFLCESFFTYVWILVLNIKWNPIKYVQYPDRLLEQKNELPAVDIFVTTADDELESPIITMNTVLSSMAVDYPVEKLACYISDDNASPLLYYALVETSKFARVWLPFCKKYDISVRAPFRYFATTSGPSREESLEFQYEWKLVKDIYEMFCKKIEDAALAPSSDLPELNKKNHGSIVKIITAKGVPHMVYISREKPHHFKSGALNALTRVSGLMTNAPFILHVDCDMYVNNPQVILHAMCLFLGVENEEDCAYVQFEPGFCHNIKDDPFENHYDVLFKFFGHGTAGIQGPPYIGSNCFFKRKVIYGLSPDQKITTGELSDLNLQRKFGQSSMLKESVARVLSASTSASMSLKCTVSSFVKGTHHVAVCDYENGTCWGTEVGWKYGSQSEDILTGLGIHRKGWKSMYCATEPASFLRCAASTVPGTMIQSKRWATVPLEIFLSSMRPISDTLNGNLSLRQCLAYMWLLTWSLRSIPELVYSLLPAYCIISGSRFLPEVSELAILIPIEVFLVFNLCTLSEYLAIGLSTRAWWNHQQMARITSTSSWLFATLSVFPKLIGLSSSAFEVPTPTYDKDMKNKDPGKFTFSKSLIFLPGTTILLVNLTALGIGMSRFLTTSPQNNEAGIGELLCSLWIVLYYWVFLKGLFAKGKYGIPSSTIVKSGVLALLFIHFCK